MPQPMKGSNTMSISRTAMKTAATMPISMPTWVA